MGGLMTTFVAVVTDDLMVEQPLVVQSRILRGRQSERRMGELALFSIGAEASDEIGTYEPSTMTVLTVRAMPTESPVIPWTVPHLRLRIDMTERTLAITASHVLGEEETLWHLREIIFM